jgi:branched-chain amino acid transport system permease protein
MAQTTAEAVAVETRSPRATRDLFEAGVKYLLLAAVGIWLVLKFIDGPQQFIQVLLNGVNNGAAYALIALGYTLVYGIIELINFSHGDLFMLATVLAGLLTVNMFGATTFTIGAVFSVIAALLICMIAAAGLNMAAERVAYRRLRRAPKLAPLITAVGLSFIYQWFGQQRYMTGSAPKTWDTMIGDKGFHIGNVQVNYSLLIVVGVTIPLLAVIGWVIQTTRAGKAMRATAQDQDAARLMGIDVDRTIAFTFALGGAMAGAAGLLYLESVGTTRYDLGFQLGLIAFTAAVLGGIGNLNGAVIGGFLIGIAQSINDGLGFGQKWSQTVVFTILILLMVFKPEGLLGKPTTEKV